MTRRRLATTAIALLAALALAGCTNRSSDEADTRTAATRPSEQDDVRLTDLASVEQLRTRFNQDRGTPRLILLLSPT